MHTPVLVVSFASIEVANLQEFQADAKVNDSRQKGALLLLLYLHKPRVPPPGGDAGQDHRADVVTGRRERYAGNRRDLRGRQAELGGRAAA